MARIPVGGTAIVEPSDGVIDLACQAAYCLTLIDPDTAT